MEYICPIFDELRDTTPTPYERDGWQLVRCNETGLIFLPNPPAYEALEENFAWEETSVAERMRRRDAEPFFMRLSSLAKSVRKMVSPNRNHMAELAWSLLGDRCGERDVRILDVGCGTGNLMVDLVGRFAERSATAVPMGIEVSKALSAKANARFEPFGGLVVFASAIEGAPLVEDGSVDLIVMHSFLEHEARPKVLLEELRSTLTPDGLVALKVPNFACWNRVLRGGRWCGFRYPDHVNYFTPDTLRTLVETSGYQIVRQNFSDRFPLSDNMYAVLSVSQ